MISKMTSWAGLLLLSACASAPPVAAPCPPAPLARPAAPPLTDELLAFQAGLRSLSSAELNQALLEQQAGGGAAAIVRRAMLLAALRGPGDLGRAPALLEPLPQAGWPDSAALAPLARFLSAAYGDLRRADEAAEKLAQQWRDGQRRYEQLNDKLEALKNIERAMVPRPAGQAVAK